MKEKIKFTIVLLVFAQFFGQAQNSNYYTEHFTKVYYTRIFYADMNAQYNLINPTWRQQHAQQVMQNNEFQRNTIGQDANIYGNPLLIDGNPLDYGSFDMTTSGKLSVVKGNPISKDAQPIPFNVSLRRNGQIVKSKKMSFLNKQLFEVELTDIMPFVKPGDVLIVNPVRVEDWKAKRILKLLQFKGEGC